MGKETYQETTISQAINKIFKLLWLDKKDISAIYIYSVFAGLVALSLPLGIQSIITFVMAAQMSTSIGILIALVLTGTFLTGWLQVRQLEIIEKIEQKLFVRYAMEYAHRIPKLDISKLDSYHLPELVNRFIDVGSLQKSLHKLLVDIPASIIQIILGTILLAFYHPLFIAFGLVLLLIVILIIRFTSARGFKTSLETSNYKYQTLGWFEEMARSIKTFKYARDTNLHLDKTDGIITSYVRARTDHFAILKVQYWSMISFKLLITAAMLILGVTLLTRQQINIGQFIASDIVIIAIIASVEKLIVNMDQVYESLTAVEKLNKVAQADIEHTGTIKFDAAKASVSISFEDVSFAYQASNTQLKNINLEVANGEWLLIKGDSGAGKTTLLRMLTGAFQDFTGKILIDGIPIRNYDIDSLRNQTSILLGHQNIFEGTVLENLSLGTQDVSLEHISAMAKITGLDVFIQGLPNGYDSILDPVGKRISAIIKHQLLLTRALIGKHSLVVMEEPFSYLNQVQKDNLKAKLKADGSTVIITSKDDHCENLVNQTIILKNGEISYE
ncbi:ATP-binding cassette domain-containing protein [uncultured Arcticibacterium sp.]|uniref:peptidase domain-containing ABC transporter n=1 Tax=uncultured Arcticibacterium sp. TaxID=2173042 RepID=UPI0030F62D47